MATIDINKVINESIQEVMNEADNADTAAQKQGFTAQVANGYTNVVNYAKNEVVPAVTNKLEDWKHNAADVGQGIAKSMDDHPYTYVGAAAAATAAGLGALALRKRIKALKLKGLNTRK